MIAGLPFEAAAKEIGVIITGLQSIQLMEENDVAHEALVEALLSELHLTQAQHILNGEVRDEPTMLDMFMKAQETLHDLGEYVGNEYASTEDKIMLAELDTANHLINDAVEIINRAKFRAEGHLRDRKTARVILQTMGEFFTVDHTTHELRFTGIPEEYRK